MNKNVLLIVILVSLFNSGSLFAHPSHDDHADLEWKEELRVFCLGHGADHPEGYLRVNELMTDFQIHIEDLDHLIKEIKDDRPLSRLSYFIHNAVLGKSSKLELLRKCFKKSIANSWHETQYFFVSETNILSYEELLTAQNSLNESIASAANRALSEKRYVNNSLSTDDNKIAKASELNAPDKEPSSYYKSFLWVVAFAVVVFASMFLRLSRKKLLMNNQ